MKLLTHVSSSLLMSLWFVSNNDSLEDLGILFIILVISNYSLDTFGHRWISIHGRMIPARNRLHSLLGVTLWGILFGIVFLVKGNIRLFTAVLIAMYIHYLEDAVTEGGVYLSGKKRRLPIRVSYDNPLVNKFTILLFFGMDIPVLAGLSLVQLNKTLYSTLVIMYSFMALVYV